MVWATLPCVLPSVESVACVAAFCNLEANGPNGAFPAILAHRAESDQLPSTVSLLQRTGSPDHPVRLCTIDVNRGVTGERVHQRLLRGHSAVPGCDVVALLPHPHSSLAASLSSSGELFLWDSAALSWCSPQQDGDYQRAPHEDGVLLESMLAWSERHSLSTPACLLRVPGNFSAFLS